MRLLLLAMTVSLVGCQPKQTDFEMFDGQRAYAEVEALVRFTPRDAGTPGGRQAAEHILSRLESIGVQAEIDTFVDATPEGDKTFRNVIGRIPGKTEKWIILGSHFDTMPGIENFQGANDS
ncbi:MAG: M28 family peptidase, partial [Pontiella sp.]|nr:M28 family peptidase [Pontiella sp.]